MKVKTCNAIIDLILEKFYYVKDSETISSDISFHVVNKISGVDFVWTGSIYRQDNAYMISLNVEDYKCAADIHNHSNDLKFGDTYKDRCT